MTSKLDHYRVPENVREGVWFELEGGLRVRATLPVIWNRPYYRAMLEKIGDVEADDFTRADAIRNMEAMQRVFNEICIVEIDDPDAPPLPLDFDEWFSLITEVMSLAQEEAAKAVEKRDAMVKKRKTT